MRAGTSSRSRRRRAVGRRTSRRRTRRRRTGRRGIRFDQSPDFQWRRCFLSLATRLALRRRSFDPREGLVFLRFFGRVVAAAGGRTQVAFCSSLTEPANVRSWSEVRRAGRKYSRRPASRLLGCSSTRRDAMRDAGFLKHNSEKRKTCPANPFVPRESLVTHSPPPPQRRPAWRTSPSMPM